MLTALNIFMLYNCTINCLIKTTHGVWFYSYNDVLKYLSPLLGDRVTTFLPFPKRLATLSAAAILAPEEIPTNIPSSIATRRAISIASSFSMS